MLKDIFLQVNILVKKQRTNSLYSVVIKMLFFYTCLEVIDIVGSRTKAFS